MSRKYPPTDNKKYLDKAGKKYYPDIVPENQLKALL